MKQQTRNIFGIVIAAVFLSLFIMLIPRTVYAEYNTGDDYPEYLKEADKDALIDPWRFLNRECTSFVAWCLNSRNEVNFTHFYKTGSGWGDAYNWGHVAEQLGFVVDQNPAVGAVAWWDHGSYGHVAWVSAVNGNKVTIEEYNALIVGGYNTAVISVGNPTGYIHIKDLEESAVSAAYTGLTEQDGQLIYLNKGEIDTSYTNIVQYQGDWYYVKNGVVDFTCNSIEPNENGWWYLKDGVVDFSYTGFASNENGWWYVENGRVTFTKNDVLYGAANTEADEDGEEAWWYIQNSKVTAADTIAENAYGWWKIADGKVDFTFQGFASNENGWWYLENGRVSFGIYDIIYGAANTDPYQSGENAWWLVLGSRVTRETTVAQNKYGWWYVKDGKVDFDYTGFASNENGWWYLENGQVKFNKYDILYGVANTDPYASGEEGWWLVRGSWVARETTVAQNKYGWWYVKDGKVDFNHNGVEQNDYGWWRIENGKVNFNFTGLAENENGTWYLSGGRVDFYFNGTYDGKTIVNGKVQ